MRGMKTTAVFLTALHGLAVGSLVVLAAGVWKIETRALLADLESALGRASARPIPFQELDRPGHDAWLPLQSIWSTIEEDFQREANVVAANLSCVANATLLKIEQHGRSDSLTQEAPGILGGARIADPSATVERELYLHLQRFGLTVRFQGRCHDLWPVILARLKLELAALALIAIAGTMALLGWRSAYRRAARSTEIRRESIDMLAHELGNPLTTLRLWSQQHGLADDPVFNRQMTRMERLAGRIKAASRASVPESETVIDLLDPDQVLASVIQERYASRIEAGKMLVASNNLSATVVIDSADLEIVLLNLIDNALQYGGPDPTITIVSQVRDQRWEVTIRDDGPGIDPGQLAEALDRRHPRNRRRQSSMGLGLYLCSRIVERNQGKLSVCNVTGGTEARLTLPLVES